MRVQSLVRGHRDALRGVHRRDSDFYGFLLHILAKESIVYTLGGRLNGTDGPRGSRTIVATSRPTGTSTLGARTRRISAAILAVGDTEVGVVWLVLHSVDSLDGVRNVCEVNKSAVPVIAIKMQFIVINARCSLLLEEVDELNITVLAEIPL